MWIRELPKDYKERWAIGSVNNMLWQNGNVYVMDNHMASAWCWLKHCNPDTRYNFMHIDRHYDLIDIYDVEDISIIKTTQLSFDSFVGLKRKKDDKLSVFSWDNYIMISHALYPKWFNTNIFLTQRDGTRDAECSREPLDIHEEDPLTVDFSINQYIVEQSRYLYSYKHPDDNKLKWIVSVDLDFFFNSNYILLFSDDYIRTIARRLQEGMDHIQVLTIALSPDCCGQASSMNKWDYAFRVLKVMSEELTCLKEFPFDVL